MSVTFSSKHGAAQFFPVLKIAGDAAVRAPVALNRAVCLIGRRWGVHLPLASKLVSKVHALIVKERDRVYIRDLASRNRVYVNGETVREADLGPGDVVAVGPYKLHCASGFHEPDLAEDAAPRAAAAVLELNGGVDRVPLEARAVLIGSRAECDVPLPDENVSSVHAVIFELDGKRYVRDLDSSGGTYVNGTKVHQQELTFGDEIRVGQTRLRYAQAGAPANPPAEAAHDSSIGLALEDSGSPVPVQDIDAEIESVLGITPSTPAPAEPDPTPADIDLDPDAPISLQTDELEPPAAPPAPEAPQTTTVQKIATSAPETVELTAEEDDELLPILAGDRTVGVIDAAVHEAANDPDPLKPSNGDTPAEAFVPIPMAGDVNSDSVVGGLLASESAGLRQGNAPHEIIPLDLVPRKPISPDETVTPDSGPDRIVDPDPAAPAHPLMELVRELQDEIPPAKEDRHKPEAPEFEDLLKYDGAQAMTLAGNGDQAPGGIRKAARKLDRIVSELSDRVADLKTTWKHVRDDRSMRHHHHADDHHPPTLRDDD